MKNQIKLSDLSESVKNLAREFGEDYYSVGVELSSHSGLHLEAYINGFSHVKGNTIAEVLSELRAIKNPELKKSNIEDVII